MFRLVFRPYTHIRRTICTSVSLRAFTRVSSGFTLCMHSSTSFGSHHVCSDSNLFYKRPVNGADVNIFPPHTFIVHMGFLPKYLHTCQTPWSVFQDGSDRTILSISLMYWQLNIVNHLDQHTKIDRSTHKKQFTQYSIKDVHLKPQTIRIPIKQSN